MRAQPRDEAAGSLGAALGGRGRGRLLAALLQREARLFLFLQNRTPMLQIRGCTFNLSVFTLCVVFLPGSWDNLVDSCETDVLADPGGQEARVVRSSEMSTWVSGSPMALCEQRIP